MNAIEMEEVLAPANVGAAWRKVRTNRGAAGEDAMSVGDIEADFDRLWQSLERAIRSGSYRPMPLRPVRLRKPSGGFRGLAIPSVLDRVLHQALAAPLQRRWNPRLSACAFAYRPGLGPQDAIDAALGAAAEFPEPVALRLDIADFFDRVDHRLVGQMLAATPCAEAVHQLVMDAVAAPLAALAGPVARPLGLPQGSPLSPVLSNAVLLPFDRALAGPTSSVRLLRYADDMLIIAPGHEAARQALEVAVPALAELGLELNAAKTRCTPLDETEFLGHGFQRANSGDWVRALPAATVNACRTHLRCMEDSAKSPAEMRRYLQQWIAWFLPDESDRLRHVAQLGDLASAFDLGPETTAMTGTAGAAGSGNRNGRRPATRGARPPAGFGYSGSRFREPAAGHRTGAGGPRWHPSWVAGFVLRRCRVGLTFQRRRGRLLPLPSGLRISVGRHHFHIRF